MFYEVTVILVILLLLFLIFFTWYSSLSCVFTPERLKEETQEESQDQTLRAEENTIPVQQRIV
jgi:Na+-transporting methylmalonyl-CoA/oxaloacetate decarboxylase gamma subunit